MARLQERRRSLAGRTGCGLCGVDSIEAAMRPVTVVGATPPVSREAIERAMAALPLEQRINRANGATHAAGWARPTATLVAVREDVGRHNALDKLGGALARSGALQPGGFVVVTSRCSYEMVHKAAALGAAAIAAVSAPTSLAIENRRAGGHRPGCLSCATVGSPSTPTPTVSRRERAAYLRRHRLEECRQDDLVERLVAEFVRRGLTVNTVKHGHHDLDVDHPGRIPPASCRRRHRGGGRGGHRYAIMREQEEPTLAEVLAAWRRPTSS